MHEQIALWIKIAYTVQLTVILPVYSVVWGWRNVVPAVLIGMLHELG